MPASIVLPKLGRVTGCVVKNLSSTGAKIVLEQAMELPPVFWLRIDGNTELRYCSDKWHREKSIGIDFTAERAVQAIDEEARNVRRRMRLSNNIHARDLRWVRKPLQN